MEQLNINNILDREKDVAIIKNSLKIFESQKHDITLKLLLLIEI